MFMLVVPIQPLQVMLDLVSQPLQVMLGEISQPLWFMLKTIRQPLRVMLTLLKRLPVQNTSPKFPCKLCEGDHLTYKCPSIAEVRRVWLHGHPVFEHYEAFQPPTSLSQ